MFIFQHNEFTYEWDEQKSDANVRRGRVDFIEIQHFNWETAESRVAGEDSGGLPKSRREPRTKTIGDLHGYRYVVVWTWRDMNIRIISMRPASAEDVFDTKICMNCRWLEDTSTLHLYDDSQSIGECGYPTKERIVRWTDSCRHFESWDSWWRAERLRRPASGGLSYDAARYKSYHGLLE